MSMEKLRNDLNVTTPSDFSEIYNIKFEFHDGSYKTNKFVQNIFAFDTESNSGFIIPGTKLVAKLDQDMYDRGILKTHGKTKDEIDYDDPDVKYMIMIDNAKPVGLMYMWQIAIEDGFGGIKAFIGRTWEQLDEFLAMVSVEIRRQMVFGFKAINRPYQNKKAMATKYKAQAYLFTHNLAFDYQYTRNLYNDTFGLSRAKHGAVFARKPRKPMKADVNIEGTKFEFRDTLVYSQKSLKNWAKDSPNCPIEKLDETFDYTDFRTPEDKLTPEEEHYGINDCLIIVYNMAADRDTYGGIENLPLTQTGKVRKVLHERVCAPRPDWAYNCAMMTKNYDLDEYKKRMMVYQGGYTHACSRHVGKVLEFPKCKCYDFASSYPSACTTSKYALFGYEPCDVSEFETLEKEDVENPHWRWFMKVKFKNIHTVCAHTYWSSSKCVDADGLSCDNGRIYSAKEITVWMMDLDWYTFKQVYHWKEMEVLEIEKGEAGYLPTEMILTILDYYGKKTALKGTDRESEYIESKEFINSIYGCFVYKQVAPQVTFEIDGWHTLDVETEEQFVELIKQISEENAFGFFDLGMTVSAIARKRLWDFIIHFSTPYNSKVWYVDTDSIKGEFDENDIDWINSYNANIEAVENRIANELGFDPNLYCPLTIKGKRKRLGIMEREDDCGIKTLGAKRYVTQYEDGSFHTTIAGLPKKAGENKIKSFDDFNDNTLWTTKESQKLCCYYVDDQPETHWMGRDGKVYVSHDKYGVCLKPVTFDLSLSDDFVAFLELIFGGILKTDGTTPSILVKK